LYHTVTPIRSCNLPNKIQKWLLGPHNKVLEKPSTKLKENRPVQRQLKFVYKQIKAK